MKNAIRPFIGFTALTFLIIVSKSQLVSQNLDSLLQSDMKGFVAEVTKGSSSDFDKAQKIVKWLVNHFEWKATDYKNRTVKEIINRRGGNCNELAVVTTALFKEAGITMRRVREINLHAESLRRQQNARQKIAEKGNQYSVFGRRHNDHVWLEIYDGPSKIWQPADPSLGIVGIDEWLKARVIFEPRNLLDSSGYDMIVPIAIFAQNDNGEFVENRTGYYVVESFNGYYSNKMETLPSWGKWKSQLDAIDDKCKDAFLGKYNLHDSEQDLDLLFDTYQHLKVEIAGK